MKPENAIRSAKMELRRAIGRGTLTKMKPENAIGSAKMEIRRAIGRGTPTKVKPENAIGSVMMEQLALIGRREPGERLSGTASRAVAELGWGLVAVFISAEITCVERSLTFGRGKPCAGKVRVKPRLRVYLVCFSHIGCRGIQCDPVEQANHTHNQKPGVKVPFGSVE
ncbi:hypothetical protein ABG768_028091 [Culter alburnus]|uniref:Uncharacterized protein n=1 Tax=Culter alburnus TaxID=194366 RepID=A0AAW2AA12_CULAL